MNIRRSLFSVTTSLRVASVPSGLLKSSRVVFYAPTTAEIMALRGSSGAGLLDCKKALVEFNGNSADALKHLRAKGLAKAEKRATATAAHGTIVGLVSEDRRSGVLVEINAETDFASRSGDFISFAESLGAVVLEGPSSPAAAKAFEGEAVIPPLPEGAVDPEASAFDQRVASHIPKLAAAVVPPLPLGGSDSAVAAATSEATPADAHAPADETAALLQARLGERVVVRRGVRFQIPEGLTNAEGKPLPVGLVRVYVHNKLPGTRCGPRATLVALAGLEGVPVELLDKVATDVALSCCTYHGLSDFTSWKEFGLLANQKATLGQTIQGRARAAVGSTDGIAVLAIKSFILGAQ